MIVEELKELLNRKLRIYVVATGAGAGIQNAMWQVPGASKFLYGAAFPYHQTDIHEFLGYSPGDYAQSYCGRQTVLDLAMEAYRRAIFEENDSGEAVGLAISASVASLKEHRGDHRVHAACMTKDKVIATTLILNKGVGEMARHDDGSEADLLGIRTLQEALGTRPEPGSEDIPYDFHDVSQEAREQFFLRPVFRGRRRETARDQQGLPIFAGAFNPPHEGHHYIAKKIREQYPDCVFSICSTARHKPALTVQEMLQRTKLFDNSTINHRVMFTQGDPFYIHKARNAPNTPLILGVDSLERMLDPHWGLNPEEMFAEFAQLGTTFFVFGRFLPSGEYMDPWKVIDRVRPEALQKLFIPMQGQHSASSSAIRAKRESPLPDR